MLSECFTALSDQVIERALTAISSVTSLSADHDMAIVWLESRLDKLVSPVEALQLAHQLFTP